MARARKWAERPNGLVPMSALLAARNGEGIQGIAPDAEVFSYRILNERVCWEHDRQPNAPLMADISNRRIEVVNNSWASFYEINDFSSSVIESALNLELNSYRKILQLQDLS